MALPLPNLDTRTWADLAQEGRYQIPVSAPTWTDHNVHDPGITLIELMAWVVEATIYRANTVPDRHLRKFLALAGFAPRGPTPSRVVLAVSGATSEAVPAGTLFTSVVGSREVTVRTLTSVMPTSVRLVAAYAFDGALLVHRSAELADVVPFQPFGSDPEAFGDPDEDPALYLGFDAPLPAGREVRLFMHVREADVNERARLHEELAALAEVCGPRVWTCPDPQAAAEEPGACADPPPEGPDTPLDHHATRTVWEWRSASGWEPLPEGSGVVDTTRSLTLAGVVRVNVPGIMAATRLAEDESDRFYLRCRLERGRPDAAPTLDAVSMNAVVAKQSVPAWDTIPVAVGATVPAALVPGRPVELALLLDAAGSATNLSTAVDGAPRVLVMAYKPPTDSEEGVLRSTLVRVTSATDVAGLLGSGLPDQTGRLPGSPADPATVCVCSVEAQDDGSLAASSWTVVPDLDPAGARDRWVTLDAEGGDLDFGTGVQGAVPPDQAALVARYEATLGADGNATSGSAWHLVADAYTRAHLGTAFPALAGLEAVNLQGGEGGAGAESISAAARRAAAFLWAHEQLVELADRYGSESLDQVPPLEVLACAAPARATTTLDYERLALAVLGTSVRRARAWAGHDPRLGCLEAPGTVTVVLVPELPTGRPSPTPGLVEWVRRFLYRRRVLGTRLYVTGPRYVELEIEARLVALPHHDASSVADRAEAAVRAHLDPLVGGPEGCGWPFGRDVTVPDVLRVLDGATGVDYVDSLTLRADGEDESCGRGCVPPTGLVWVSRVSLEVIEP